MTAVDYQKGQRVTFNADTRGESPNGYSRRTFAAGDAVVVTRIYRERITIRGDNGKAFNVNRSALHAPNGEVYVRPEPSPDRPKPRKLGTTPEGDHIAINDPRIAWIWADAEKVSASYCSVYDEITNKLGIPGRMRDIRVNMKINGIDVTGVIKARSSKDAEALFRSKLTGVPVPVPTPA